MKNLPGRQRGVALMIVIFIFALVSILSVGMYNRQSLFLQMTGNIPAQSQAYEYARASEIYGRSILRTTWEDKQNDFIDDLDYVKNSSILPVDDAFIEAQINDLQSRLNINDLVLVDGETPNNIMVTRFRALLGHLAIETINVEVLLDWIDSDQEPSGIDGIEDGEYLSLEIPYRNAGQPFRHISELLLVMNISQDDYNALKPHVSLLPQGYATINVNTATKEVLMSLSDKLTTTQIDEIIAHQEGDNPWTSLSEFMADSIIAGSGLKQDNLGVMSEFFEIATVVTLSDRKVRLASVIYRNNQDGVIQVLFRDQGRNKLITKDRITL